MGAVSVRYTEAQYAMMERLSRRVDRDVLQTREEQGQKAAYREAKAERQQSFGDKIAEHFAHIVPAVGAFFGWVWDAVGALF